MEHVNLRKRTRDEDEEELGELRAVAKKPRNLPFRDDPTTQHSITFSQSIRKGPRPTLPSGLLTPTESVEDVSERASFEEPSHPYDTPPRTKSSSYLSEAFTRLRDNPDEDVDMTEAQDSPIAWWQSPPAYQSSPIPSPLTLGPNGRRLSADHGLSSRIPTPIYGHFQSLDVMDTDANALSRPSVSHTNQPLRPRVLRLPTAIEEDESMDSFEDDQAAAQLRRPTSCTSPPSTATDPLRRPMASALINKLRSWAQGDRSSSTIPSGGKAVLSMGYRADCQKCVNKVPGHFNHIIREARAHP